MNINRHNYEEFFLLYVDRELTAPQLTTVENFLQQNPDLRQELEMLQQVVLSENNELKFEGKEGLYKTEQGINPGNYEAYFLLYVDNELNAVEKQEVEKFVLQHPSLQEGFTALRATRLNPETIIFKNKERLYRSAQSERVIPLKWFRVAAAAAVLGFVTLLWLNGSNSESPVVDHGIAQREVGAKGAVADVKTPAIKAQPEVAVHEHQSSGVVPDMKRMRDVVLPAAKTTIAAYKHDRVNQLPQLGQKEENALSTEDKDKSAVVQTLAIQDGGRSPVSGEQSATGKRIPAVSNLVAVAGNKSPAQVHQAVYYENVPEEDDRSIYIGGAEINRNKLRGLFKKAAGIFDRKGKKADDENTVQIASFEIKTK